jgi:hypothetical protein
LFGDVILLKSYLNPFVLIRLSGRQLCNRPRVLVPNLDVRGAGLAIHDVEHALDQRQGQGQRS